jgi:hypothetical protein
MNETAPARWLLLIHQIPPKPEYLRVKIWRRIQRVGAVAVKNSVYVMPRTDQALEDFQWIRREIAERGGDASICEAGFVDGLSDAQVEAMFRAARDADYKEIADEARGLARRRANDAAIDSDGRTRLAAEVTRLRRRLSEVVALDFFDALGRQTAEGLLTSLEQRLRPPVESPAAADVSGDLRKRVWVTRKGLHVDRMASAWLIRRFIDPAAQFKFVPARGYQPQAREVRFDMFEADFTHEGDHCTFEVLAKRMKLDGTGLRAIGEIVHDIDLKDAKFRRPEAAGIARLIAGICAAHKDDETRLERASALFDDLHESFARRSK